VVTIQDLERASSEETVSNLRVADITQRDIITTFPDEPLSKALRYMSDRGFGRLPVVDRQKPTQLVGLLRRENIVRAYRFAVLRKLEAQHRRQNVRLGNLTDTEVLEVPLSSGMAAVGRRIRDLDLPPEVLITTIRRDDQVIIAHGETLLQPGDTIVVLTQRQAAEDVRRALVGEM
jgi:K+/H+ antiporter YhaU regulatory subunit KhtT